MFLFCLSFSFSFLFNFLLLHSPNLGSFRGSFYSLRFLLYIFFLFSSLLFYILLFIYCYYYYFLFFFCFNENGTSTSNLKPVFYQQVYYGVRKKKEMNVLSKTMIIDIILFLRNQMYFRSIKLHIFRSNRYRVFELYDRFDHIYIFYTLYIIFYIHIQI